MIRLEAALDEDGILVGYRAEGHACAGRKGADIVCAAVSALSRAFVRALRSRKDVSVRADAPGRGLFHLELGYSGEARLFLEGAGTFLLEGLSAVAEEYPECCNLTVVRK
jgi:uncharacterized protein YsxB (DUF464 family)